MSDGFAVAAAQYPVEALRSWADYAAKIERWLADAARGGAQLAVFPEYGAMELASLDPATMGDLAGSLAFVASLAADAATLHARLAGRFGLHVLAASMPERDPDGLYRNRARLYAPNGKNGAQDKRIMTRFEREQWDVAPGRGARVFDTELGRIGVLVCYEAEFPLLARAAVDAGAEVLLAPSCTDTLQGYWRVRVGAQARALENQCLVVQSPTVGEAAWSPAVDVNRGAAGVFAPPDGGFPDDGVVALGEVDRPAWITARIDLAASRAVRESGAVFNHRHWTEQPGAGALPDVEVVDLR